MCKTRLRRRFIHGLAADAKFESAGESSSTSRSLQGPGKLGNVIAATPKGSDQGNTSGEARRSSFESQLAAQPRGRGSGVTR